MQLLSVSKTLLFLREDHLTSLWEGCDLVKAVLLCVRIFFLRTRVCIVIFFCPFITLLLSSLNVQEPFLLQWSCFLFFLGHVCLQGINSPLSPTKSKGPSLIPNKKLPEHLLESSNTRSRTKLFQNVHLQLKVNKSVY